MGSLQTHFGQMVKYVYINNGTCGGDDDGAARAAEE
jgi:hypothetical protein